MYFIINKHVNIMTQRDTAREVGTYLLGKSIKYYLIIKSVDGIDKLYTPTTPDVFVIERELEAL